MPALPYFTLVYSITLNGKEYEAQSAKEGARSLQCRALHWQRTGKGGKAGRTFVQHTVAPS